MKLLLIRHGESVANEEGRVQGQFDSPLNERGRDQARALAQRLLREEWSISAIYASDLKRAAETADILASSLDIPLTLDERLREYDVGVLTGVVWREIEFLHPEIWEGFQDSSIWTPIPGEEGTEPFHRRLATAAQEIHTRHQDDEAAAIVSHGGSLGVLLAHYLGMDVHRPTPFRLGNTSLSIIEFGPRRLRLLAVNDTCHLDGDLR